LYNVPVDKDGFLREGPAKLRPVEFAPDGIFLAGLAHYPKPIEESTAQAQAAVSSAVRVLSTRWFNLEQAIARVDELNCDLCGVCIGVCPYKALAVKPEDSADKAETRKLKLFVQPAKCKGCGACQAACPREGISIMGFSNGQLIAQVIAALDSKVK
jgi:heterodisulfide reductase subunit A